MLKALRLTVLAALLTTPLLASADPCYGNPGYEIEGPDGECWPICPFCYGV